jgi:hypothetical protein
MFDKTLKSHLYPQNWRAIAREIKALNGWRCQACGLQCRRPGELWLGWEYEMACAHICQDYAAEAVFVAALCTKCHLRHDARFSWIARQRRGRLRQRLAGQLTLTLKIP